MKTQLASKFVFLARTRRATWLSFKHLIKEGEKIELNKQKGTWFSLMRATWLCHDSKPNLSLRVYNDPSSPPCIKVICPQTWSRHCTRKRQSIWYKLLSSNLNIYGRYMPFIKSLFLTCTLHSHTRIYQTVEHSSKVSMIIIKIL